MPVFVPAELKPYEDPEIKIDVVEDPVGTERVTEDPLKTEFVPLEELEEVNNKTIVPVFVPTELETLVPEEAVFCPTGDIVDPNIAIEGVNEAELVNPIEDTKDAAEALLITPVTRAEPEKI